MTTSQSAIHLTLRVMVLIVSLFVTGGFTGFKSDIVWILPFVMTWAVDPILKRIALGIR